MKPYFFLLLAIFNLYCGSALAAQRQALLIVGTVSNPDLNISDTGIKTRLEALGFDVTVVQDSASAATDANGKALVLVSSTVTSGNVAAKFRNVTVPVIVWEQAVQDDFGMTGNAGTDHATIGGQTDLEILAPSHPLAAGLSNIVTIVNFSDTFSWGLPVASAIKIAQISADPTKFPLYAYEKGAAMYAGIIAPEKRVMLPMGDASYENMTESGLKLFDAAVNWAATPVSSIPTATISIASPANGASFASGGSIVITVNASDPAGPLKRVEFFNNDVFIGQSSNAPFNFTWTSAPIGRASLVAKAIDQQDRSVASTPVNITVGNPPPEALLVVGTVSNPNLNAADTAIQQRLQQMGFLVRVVQDAVSVSGDAANKRLILISSTVTSGNVAAKFRDAAVPVLNWEQAVQDDLMMTGNTAGVDRETIGGQTDLEIVTAGHALAAGLSGTVTIMPSAETFSWGFPAETAILIAQVPGDPTKFPYYAYESGAPMFNGFVAPARRVMMWMGDPTFANMNTNGLTLFDAAVRWAANLTTNLPPVASTASVRITSPANNATVAAGSNLSITASATDTNGPIQKVEFFAGANKIGESFTAPYTFTWTNLAAGRYALTAKALDRLGLTVASEAVNIIVGNPKPDALLVVGTVSNPTLNVSDSAIVTRLEALGFNVRVMQDSASSTADASGKALVVVSSTITSGNVAAKFRNSAVPVIMWEQAVQDDFGMTGNAGTDHATLGGQTDLEILEPNHPLAAGLSNVVTIANGSDTFSWGLPLDSAIKIAQIVSDPTKFPLYAYESGAAMFGGFAAPARRVMLPMGDASYENMTDSGLKLFDAAVNWAANLAPARPKFNAPTRGAGTIAISWTGAGTLEEASSVTGPWSTAANQANPQTVTTAGAMEFFRLRQ